jgi:hypothetical protein
MGEQMHSSIQHGFQFLTRGFTDAANSFTALT